MSWMVQPIFFGTYQPDAADGAHNGTFSDMVNMQFNSNGGIQTCPGIQEYNTNKIAEFNGLSSNFCTGIYNFLSGQNNYVVVNSFDITNATQTKWFSVLSGVTIPTWLSGNTIQHPTFETLNGYMFVFDADSNSQPRYWKGSGNFGNLSAGIYPQFPEVHYDRLFGAGSKDYPSRVWWSDIKDPFTWNTGISGCWTDINPDDGDVITGIKSFMGDLYVFKRFNVYKIIGNDFDPTNGNFQVIQVTGMPGCKSHNSIVVSHGAMFYFSDDGVLQYSAGGVEHIGYGVIDNKIDYWIRTIYDPSSATQIIGAENPRDDEIWWSVATQGLIIWNIHQQKWSMIQHSMQGNTLVYGNPPRCTAICTKADTSINTFLGWFNVGTYQDRDILMACLVPSYAAVFQEYIYKLRPDLLSGVNYDGVAIKSYCVTDWIYFGSFARKNSANLIINAVCNGSLHYEAYLDYDSTTIVAQGDIDFSTRDAITNKTNIRKIPLITSAAWRHIKLKLQTNAVETYFILNYAQLEFDLDTESGRI